MEGLVEAPPVTEQGKVDAWRIHVLVRAGYPLPLAELVAVSSADLHRAVELVRDGCDPVLAARILL